MKVNGNRNGFGLGDWGEDWGGDDHGHGGWEWEWEWGLDGVLGRIALTWGLGNREDSFSISISKERWSVGGGGLADHTWWGLGRIALALENKES